MRFGKLFDIFNKEDINFGDVLSESLGEEKLQSRKFLESHIENLRESDIPLALRVEEEINNLMVKWTDIALVAGYIIGQEFDIVDLEVLMEIKFLKKKLIDGGIIHYLARKKAPAQPSKEDAEAPSR